MSKQLEHNYALLIGVGECANSEWSLSVTVNDVKAFKEVLVSHCGYIEDNINLLFNEQATTDGILKGFKWLKQEVENDSEATVIVYYSGHGLLDKDTNEYFLVPHDVNTGLLSAEIFNQELQEIQARRLLVIIDTCHRKENGISPKSIRYAIATNESYGNLVQIAFPEVLIEQLTQGGRRAILTPSTDEQTSCIFDDKNISIYIYHLLEALQGAESYPDDKEVSVSSLDRYLDKKVAKSTHYKQKPYSKIHGDFNIGLLRGGEGLPVGGWNSIKDEVKQILNDTIRRSQREQQDNNAYDIVNVLKKGYFCYALSSPLQEKNQLLEYIKEYLKQENILFAVINPDIYIRGNSTRIPENFKWGTRDSWYQKLVDRINKDFELNYRAQDWWNEHRNEYNNESLELLKNYIEKVLFHQKKRRKLFIIFDFVIKSQKKDEYRYLFDGLKFKNEFYDFIYDCYEMRGNNRNYRRLNFIFLDTVTWSSDISNDGKKPPFNVVWKIDMNRDNKINKKPIISYGIEKYIPQVNIEALIERIWYWTNGNPFLMKILFHKLTISRKGCIAGKEGEYIDKLVEEINTSWGKT